MLRLRVASLRFATWQQVAAIGLPTSGEFLLMFVISGVVYRVLGRLGSDARQASASARA